MARIDAEVRFVGNSSQRTVSCEGESFDRRFRNHLSRNGRSTVKTSARRRNRRQDRQALRVSY